jgi:two-component system, NtrC family, sensor histidine kinase PilS
MMDLSIDFSDNPDSSKRRRFALLTWLRFGFSILLTILLAWVFGGGDKASNALSPTFIAGVYALACFTGLWVMLYSNIPWPMQLFGQLIVEVILIALMVASLGGGAGGYAILFMMPIAAAASLMSWTSAMLICSVSALSLLIDGLRRASLGVQTVDWVLIGLLGMAGFALMALLRLAAQRTESVETLARQAQTQALLAQELSEQHLKQDTLGWLVLDEQRVVRLHNEPARSLAWLAGQTLEMGAVIDASSPLNVWLERSQQGAEFSVDWPPPQSDSAIKREQLFIKTSSLPHLNGYIALTLELSSARSAKARELSLAAMGRLSASIAHEIRNPLAAISQAAELLQESNALPARDAPLLAMVLTNAQRIERIVHNLLSWSRGTQAAPVAFAPHDTLTGIVQQICVGLQLKPAQLQLDTPTQVLQTVRFDTDHLYQIVSNLISNAARFASAAPASIRLTLKPRGAFVALLVLDDGAPVDGQVAQNLFEPFQSGSKQGTGLGLFLCREYAQANQASLELLTESNAANGWVQVPYTKAFVLNMPVDAPASS